MFELATPKVSSFLHSILRMFILYPFLSCRVLVFSSTGNFKIYVTYPILLFVAVAAAVKYFINSTVTATS